MIPELFKQILNNLHQQLESKMNEKLEHVIPHFLNQTDSIIRWQANSLIAHTCQLPRRDTISLQIHAYQRRPASIRLATCFHKEILTSKIQQSCDQRQGS